MQVQILRFKPLEGRNSLRASVDILFPNWGVEVRNIAYHENDDGRRWLQIPGEGKSPFLIFQDKREFQNFQVSAIGALDEFLKFGGSDHGAKS